MIQCNLCPELVKSRSRICHGRDITSLRGEEFDSPRVMVIIDSPNPMDEKSGLLLSGNAGEEAMQYLHINGILGHGVWLGSLIKCLPPGDRGPLTPEIEMCTETHLIPEILELQPKLIISMGRVSTQWFLGSVNMEMVHGIPRPVEVCGFQTTLLPSFHPAAGLSNPELMIQFHTDLQVAGDVLRGKISPHPPVDKFAGIERYTIAQPEDLFPLLGQPIIAVDTEWARGNMWCLSISDTPGEAFVVKADQEDSIEVVRAIVSSPDTITVIQNSLYDLPVLAQQGIFPARVADTMVMAYLLQSEPQGLKPLAFRHCGMVMNEYTDMVGDITQEMARDYMEEVLRHTWPDPELVLKWENGEPKVTKPQNIARKVKAALKKGEDLFDKWKKMDGTDEVEQVLGPMQHGELCDISEEDAVRYSARDADATIRIFPILWERIVALGLEDTFWRDMRAIPMVVDMMANGMPVNLSRFGELSSYFQGKMDEIQAKIQAEVGYLLDHQQINPASSVQMSLIIYDKLRLHEKGGKFKSKKGASIKSTADDVMKRYINLHPVIPLTMEWRGYQKLKTSYADSIPKLVSADKRIRTTLRITRVATGRLSSSNPNLMAQPTRSEEGRKVRDCYEAEEGNVFLSCDYSQVEMRVAASDSGDEKMIGIFLRGEDIHRITASEMFGVPISQVEEMKHRYPAKRVGFGILNLITAEGLQRELAVGGAGNWTVADCEFMIKAWFDIYRGIAAYMKANGAYAKRYSYVRDMWGRIRYIPGIRSANKWTRIEAERQAGNGPIQMGAQGVIKEAMGRLVPVYRDLSSMDLGPVLPLIQIHDDIVWEVGEKILPIAKPEIIRVMEGAAPPGFRVPLEVDPKVGKLWGSMKKG